MTQPDSSWGVLPEARTVRLAPDVVVLLAGITAALHVGKLPPAIPALQQALDGATRISGVACAAGGYVGWSADQSVWVCGEAF